MRATPLVLGEALGTAAVLSAPLSFWGGVDSQGIIVDRHHPQFGLSLSGTVLVMSSSRGSSSSSSVLAELIRAGRAPVAIVLAEPDAIVVLGALVAEELYGHRTPIAVLTAAELDQISQGCTVTVSCDEVDATVTWVAP